MRIITFLTLILISSNFFSQSSQIDINWVGYEQYYIANKVTIDETEKNNALQVDEKLKGLKLNIK